MNRFVRGAVAGLVATVPMTAVIGAGRGLALFRTPPPAQITANVARETGVELDEPAVAFDAAWLGAHAGFGAVCGGLYALARPIFPRSSVSAGLLYGGAVWAWNYLGLFPALDIYPWPDDDRRPRVAVMLAAHAVYGISLADVERRL